VGRCGTIVISQAKSHPPRVIMIIDTESFGCILCKVGVYLGTQSKGVRMACKEVMSYFYCFQHEI